jgi:eukaryotic-like serine/threonine-protein kinase
MRQASEPPGPSAAPRQTRLAPWSPTASHEELRDYFEERLALFSKLMFWIFWVLVIFVIALYELHPEIKPERAAIILYCAITGLVFLGLIWYIGLHRRTCTIETLYRIDAFYAITIGALFGMSAYYSSDQVANVYTAFIWHTFMVFSRVIILPSTGARTAVITGLSFSPLFVASIAVAINYPERMGLPPVALIGGTLLFAAVAVILASTGSRVIYGLRKEVREARRLGQYILDEKIGEGGMGAVYKARHAMLRRPTAVKLLPLDKYGVDSVKRFEREVQLTSQLTHPNTVAIFDYGRSPDGVFYYAMEYLDGVDLETLVTGYGPQPAPRVIDIIRQVCGALDEAHTVGLIHRDIKPANILLCCRAHTPDVAKVVDFGLVKEITRDADESAVKIIAGTPAYLAPETVTDPDAVGPRSDLYSVGAVAYFLLTGKRIFDGNNALDVCVKQVSHAPVPPSERTDNPIPAPLEQLVLRCLAKDPAQRPASARALRDELGALEIHQEWNEAAALAWWSELEAAREAGQGRATNSHPRSPITITVDVRGRTEGLSGALANDEPG